MRISIKQLSEYVDISDLSIQEVADLLTSLGHEVEQIEVIKDQ